METTIEAYYAPQTTPDGLVLVDAENEDRKPIPLSPKLDVFGAGVAANLLNLVDDTTANHALFIFSGDDGYAPGAGTTGLMRACTSLDDDHLTRLSLGFPEIVAAYKLYGRVYGGLDLLRQRARGEI